MICEMFMWKLDIWYTRIDNNSKVPHTKWKPTTRVGISGVRHFRQQKPDQAERKFEY